MENPTTAFWLPRAIADSDPVDAFFDHMPSPQEHHTMSGKDVAATLDRAIMIFLALSEHGNRSFDRDYYELIKDAISKHWESGNLHLIYAQIASLAIDNNIEPDDSGSCKAQQLRYIRWVVNGRNDATSPFASPGSGNESADPNASSTLDRCAVCNSANATMRCGACRVTTEDGMAFSIAYCSQDCQKKHWPTHKAICKEVQQLERAVSMFTDIFRHFLEATYPEEVELKSITRQGNMVVAKTASNRPNDVTHSARFPAELADAPALANAVLMFSQCSTPLREAKSLVEMLMRPTCQSMKKVCFVPKNVTSPVRVTYLDTNDFSPLQVHEVVYVKLRCGLEFALDPTGSQMGWKHSIVPWSTFSKRHIHQIREVKLVNPHPIGHHIIVCGIKGEPAGQLLRESVMETVVHGLSRQLDFKNLCVNVRKLLQLNQGDFTVARQNIVAVANAGISTLASQVREGAKPTCSVPQNLFSKLRADCEWHVRMACSVVDFHFVTEEDVNRGEGDYGRINDLVRPRWRQQLSLGPLPGLDVKWR